VILGLVRLLQVEQVAQDLLQMHSHHLTSNRFSKKTEAKDLHPLINI
jgi:hypothetical protein